MATKNTITTAFLFADGSKTIFELPKNAHITKNFQVKELANNKAKEEVKLVLTVNSLVFLSRCQMLRDRRGVMNTTSYYRTESFNASKDCQGSKNSLHLEPRIRAMDFLLPYDKQPEWIDDWYEISKTCGFIGGFNRYPNRVHIDDYEDFYGYNKFVIRDYTKMKNGKPTITYRKC